MENGTKQTLIEAILEGLEATNPGGAGWGAEHQAAMNLANAAPDLFEALKSTLAYAEAYYRTLPDDGPEQDYVMASVIGPARAALAKAKGGAK